MKNVVGQILRNDFGKTTSKIFSRGVAAIKTVVDVRGTIQDDSFSAGEKVAISALQVTGSVATVIAGAKGGADGALFGTPFGPQGATTGAIIGATIYGTVAAEAFKQLAVDPLRTYFANN